MEKEKKKNFTSFQAAFENYAIWKSIIA